MVGAVATRYGERVAVKAHRGVVLTAGGFIWNDEMLRRHAPFLLLGTWKVGTEADDGRGIEMAQAVGARVKNMHAGEVSLPIIPPRRLIEGIIVDGVGQRFINEDTYMGRVGQAALYERDATCFLVIDEAGYEPNWMGLEASWVCETVDELEAEMGLPVGLARGHPGALQPPRRARRRPGLPQASRARAAARPSPRGLRPAAGCRAVRTLHTRRPRDDRRRRGRWTSPARRSRGCSPRGGPRLGSARSATPRASRSATRRSSAASPEELLPSRPTVI